MKSLFAITIVLPFCLAIDVRYYNIYGSAIKKVEIPSCKSEPCVLVKGTPLNITITVEATLPPNQDVGQITDLESWVLIHGYRNHYVYDVSKRRLFCEYQPNQCPVQFGTIYKINRQLFLSKDTYNDLRTVFGSRDGLTRIDVNVAMVSNDLDSRIIGDGNFDLNIKSSP